MRIDDVLQRIQGEFVEMPGLRLTPAQAQRLGGSSATFATLYWVPWWTRSFWPKRATARSFECKARVPGSWRSRSRTGIGCIRERTVNPPVPTG